jgi:hypothetical protein
MGVKRWTEAALGPMTEDAIRRIHTPSERYRVTSFHTNANSVVRGVARAGPCYVVRGMCTFQFRQQEFRLSAGDIVTLPEGGFTLTVGAEQLEYVRVFPLPPEFWKSRDESSTT